MQQRPLCVLLPAAGMKGQGLRAPAVQQVQRGLLGQRKLQRGLCGRHRQHLEGDFRQYRQIAPGTSKEAADIVAGHVLHHLAAEREGLALAVEGLHAQHEIAQRAGAGAGRAVQAAGHGSPQSAACASLGAQTRRFERQRLTVFRECGFHFGQGRAGAGGQHQLAGFMAENAAAGAGVEHGGIGRCRAQAVLAASAANAQAAAVGHGCEDGVAQCVEGGVGKMRHAAMLSQSGRGSVQRRREFFRQRL